MNHVTVECRLESVLRGPKAGQGRAKIYMSGHGPKYFKELKFKVVAPIEDLSTAVFAWITAHIDRVRPIADLCDGNDFDIHLVMHSRLPKKVPVADPTKLMFMPEKLAAELKKAAGAPKRRRPLGKKFPLR